MVNYTGWYGFSVALFCQEFGDEVVFFSVLLVPNFYLILNSTEDEISLLSENSIMLFKLFCLL